MSADGSGPGNQPVSFKTNVNRSKTKRWVEAKSYNYDGDEYGDVDEYDEYGGYDEPEPAPAAKPTGFRQAGQNAGRQGSMTIDTQRPGGTFAGQPPPQPPYGRQPHDRQNSYGRDGDRRAFSGPGPTSPPTGVAPVRTAYGQPQGPPYDPQRPSSRGPPSAGNRGSMMPGPRASTDGYRSQSMTSNSPGFPSSSVASPPPRIQPGPPRKSSFGQQEAPEQIPRYSNDFADQEPLAQPNPSRERADSKGAAFIRPADIYKRMQEEKQKQQRQSQESARPNLDVRPGSRSRSRDPSPGKSGDESDGSRRPRQPLAPVAERKSEYGMEGILSPTKAENSKQIRRTSRSPVLPQIGGFGDDFGADFGSSFLPAGDSLGATGSDMHSRAEAPRSQLPQPRQTEEEPATLQHAPSQGFRSAVNQAFDQPAIPETPSSASGSNMGRSNSESTNAISPIISRGPSDAQPGQLSIDANAQETRIASIAEETTPDTPRQGSDSTPISSSRGRRSAEYQKPAGFIPGHRRDISTPSPDNSPARKPAVASSTALRQPQEAELDSGVADASGVSSTFMQPAVTAAVEDQARPGSSSRAESPTKSRVRELAERIDSGPSSRRASRDGSINDEATAEEMRPSNTRLESFRPSLPGGWNSYTTNPTPGESKEQQIAESVTRAMAMGPTEASSDVAAPSQEEALAHADSETTPKNDPGMTLPLGERPQLRVAPSAEQSTSSIMPTPQGMADGHDLTQDAEYFSAVQPLKSKSRQDVSVVTDVGTPKRGPPPAMSIESSPSDQESDRLRKQLVRELSPQHEHAPPGNALQKTATDTSMASRETDQSRQDSSVVPSDYERYWNGSSYDSAGTGPPTARQAPPEHLSDSPGITQSPVDREAPQTLPKFEPREASLPEAPAPSQSGLQLRDGDEARNKLNRRFSWEASTEHLEEDEDVQSPDPIIHEDFPEVVTDDFEMIPSLPEQSVEALNSPEVDDLDYDSPVDPRIDREESAPPVLPKDDQPSPTSFRVSDTTGTNNTMVTSPSTAKSVAFRGIMAMKSPDDRLDHLTLSRDALMNNDHGLTQWITLAQEDVKVAKIGLKPQNLASTPGGFQTRPLPPSGGAALQPTAANTSAGSSPSGTKISGQQMQAKGKDLLHSAGLFGGKANVAAKGLFAKGKSKLKNAGGDKASSKARSASYTKSPSRKTPPSAARQIGSPVATNSDPTLLSRPAEASPVKSPPRQFMPSPDKTLPSPPLPQPSNQSERLPGQVAFPRQVHDTSVSISPTSNNAPSPIGDTRPSISSLDGAAVSKISSRPSSLSIRRDESGVTENFATERLRGATPEAIQSPGATESLPPPLVIGGEEMARQSTSESAETFETAESSIPRPAANSGDHRKIDRNLRCPTCWARRVASTTSQPRPGELSTTFCECLTCGRRWEEQEQPTPTEEEQTENGPGAADELQVQTPTATNNTPREQIITVPAGTSKERTQTAIYNMPKEQIITIPARTSREETPKGRTPTADKSPHFGEQPGDPTPTQASFPPTLPKLELKYEPFESEFHLNRRSMKPKSPESPSQRSSVALGEFESKLLFSQGQDNEQPPLPSPGAEARRRAQSLSSSQKSPVGTVSNKRISLAPDVRPFSFINFDHDSPQNLALEFPKTPIDQRPKPRRGPSQSSTSDGEFFEGGLSLREEKELEASKPDTPMSARFARPNSQLVPEPNINDHPALRAESPFKDQEDRHSQRSAPRPASIALPSPNIQYSRSSSATAHLQPNMLQPPGSPLRPGAVTRPSDNSMDDGPGGKKKKKRTSIFSSLSGQSEKSKRRNSALENSLPIDDAPELGVAIYTGPSTPTGVRGPSSPLAPRSQWGQTAVMDAPAPLSPPGHSPINPTPHLEPIDHPPPLGHKGSTAYAGTMSPTINRKAPGQPSSSSSPFTPKPGSFTQRKLSMGSDEPERGHQRSRSRQLLDRLPNPLSGSGDSKTNEQPKQKAEKGKKRRFSGLSSGIGGLLNKVPTKRSSSRSGGPPPVNTFPHIRSDSQASNPAFPPRGSSMQAASSSSHQPATLHQRQQSYATQLSLASQRSGRSSSIGSSQRPGTASSKGPTYSPFPHSRQASTTFMPVLPPQANFFAGMEQHILSPTPQSPDVVPDISRVPPNSKATSPAPMNEHPGMAADTGTRSAPGAAATVAPRDADYFDDIAPNAFNRAKRAPADSRDAPQHQRQAGQESQRGLPQQQQQQQQGRTPPPPEQDPGYLKPTNGTVLGPLPPHPLTIGPDACRNNASPAPRAKDELSPIKVLKTRTGPTITTTTTTVTTVGGGGGGTGGRSTNGKGSTTARSSSTGVSAPSAPPPRSQSHSATRAATLGSAHGSGDAQPQPPRKLRQSLPPIQTRGYAAGRRAGEPAAHSAIEHKRPGGSAVHVGAHPASAAPAGEAGSAGAERGGVGDRRGGVGDERGSLGDRRGGLEDARNGTDKELATHRPAASKRKSSDGDMIVMSSTAYPGQEWRPDFAWDGS